MKKFIALSGLLLLSFGAKADYCRTEMVDYMGYVRLIITQAQPNWYDPYCQAGYQQCLASIHLNPTMRPSCRVVRATPQNYNYNYPQPTYPRPVPQPAPRPQWNPGNDGRPSSNQPPRAGSSSGRVQPPAGRSTPAPAPAPTRPTWNANQPRIEVDANALHSRTTLVANGEETVVEVFDGQRNIEIGESVYMYGAGYTVVDVNGSDYDIQLEGSRKKKDIVRVKRDKIAISRGCSLNVCVTDPVFNISRGRMEAVAGITMNGELITKSADNGKINELAVQLKEVALAKGCVTNTAKQEVCAGNTVLAKNGRYYEVLAVQHDQKVVLRQTEVRNAQAFPNMSAADLTVVR